MSSVGAKNLIFNRRLLHPLMIQGVGVQRNSLIILQTTAMENLIY